MSLAFTWSVQTQQYPKSSKKEKALPVVSAKLTEIPNVNFDLTGFLHEK
jgi:hypothetical protein